MSIVALELLRVDHFKNSVRRFVQGSQLRIVYEVEASTANMGRDRRLRDTGMECMSYHRYWRPCIDTSCVRLCSMNVSTSKNGAVQESTTAFTGSLLHFRRRHVHAA